MLDTDELRCLVFAAVFVEVILWLLDHQCIPVGPNKLTKFTQCPDAHPMFYEVSRIRPHELGGIFESFGDLQPDLGEPSRAVAISGEHGKHFAIAGVCPEAEGDLLKGLSRRLTSSIATILIETCDEWWLKCFRHTWFYR